MVSSFSFRMFCLAFTGLVKKKIERGPQRIPNGWAAAGGTRLRW
jgi:hypothetical protein